MSHDMAPVNHFHLPDAGAPPPRSAATRTSASGSACGSSAPEEALLIEVTPPPNCDYWNFQLGNIWAESLDYGNHNVHVNNGGAQYKDDGSFRLVVAHEDPGVPNWIDTAGHHHGTMALRWVRTDAHPKPETQVVKLSDVKA